MKRSIIPDPRIGGVFVDRELPPPEPFSPSSLFELKTFQASQTVVVPFEEFEVNWLIEPKDQQTVIADYVFSLAGTYGIITDNIPASGSSVISTRGNTLLRVLVRREGRGFEGPALADTIAIEVNYNTCKTVEIAAYVIDALVSADLLELTSQEASLRLRDGRELESNWGGLDAYLNSVGYYIPLEIVINNFYDADFNVNLVVKLTVEHSPTESNLAANITHSSNVNFHWLEDVGSLGMATIIAMTANKLMPLVLAAQVKNIEKQVVRELNKILEPHSDGYRLLTVRINPEPPNFEALVFVMAPFPV